MLKCHLSLHDLLSLKNVWLVAEHADLQLAFVRPSNALNSATLINGKFEIVRTILRVFLYILGTGDPRFARFQFTRIHTTRFFQGLRGRGLMGSTEPLILKICSKTCQYCKIQEKFVTFALNQCFSNS